MIQIRVNHTGFRRNNNIAKGVSTANATRSYRRHSYAITNALVCNTRGQSILEFSLLLVVVVIGLIAIHGFVNRSIQGRMRSSTDSISSQFSAGHTNFTRTEAITSSTTEINQPDKITRTTRQDFNNNMDQKIDSFAEEVMWEI